MIDIERITNHYRTVAEAPRVPRTRSRRLDFDTTLHFLDKHLSPRATMLELGAGHGDFSFHFAERGHRVLATDLVLETVEALTRRVEQAGLGNIQVRQADATRLDSLSDWDFQAVLCLGPYYHLRTREYRRRCLLECRRVVHDRGIVAVSYLNRGYAVADLLQRGLSLSPEQYESLQQVDDSRTDYPDPYFNMVHFSTPEGVEAEVRSCGFEILDHSGTDGPYGLVGEVFEALDEAAYRDFFAYHLKNSVQGSQRGLSRHGLVILRKV